MKPVALGILVLTASAAALAQPPGGPTRPDPLDSRATVPPLSYQSPFNGYRPFAAQPPGSWRDMNDLVGRIGGWKVYARESQGLPAPPVPATGEPPQRGHGISGPDRPGPR